MNWLVGEVHKKLYFTHNNEVLENFKILLGSFLRKMPVISFWLKYRQQNFELRALKTLTRQCGEFPPGHYYSSVVGENDIKNKSQCIAENFGFDLHRDAQKQLLECLSVYYRDLPFSFEKSNNQRYYLNQGWFVYTDAIMLYSVLRELKPKRVMEVGSGFSSAVILDTVDRFFEAKPKLIFIEPNAERLKSLLRESDFDYCRIIESNVQIQDVSIFNQLEAGDLLFIDSSHVVKYGSDLQYLIFKILPVLPPGVIVHFHDIFYPFEYPLEWIQGGRHWNEAYVLRAFLMHNNQWDIYLFNSYVGSEFKDFLAENMPLCLKNTGASLYLRKRDTQ